LTEAPVETAPAPRGPIRTCVGCRTAVPQGELVRIATVQGRAVADPGRRLPGRGAYVHARPTCVAAASKGGLARSLRRNVGRSDIDALTGVLPPGSSADGGPDGGAGGPPAASSRRSRRQRDTIPPGQSGADAVEIGTPSSTPPMSNPRPSTAANATRSTTSAGGAERPR